MNKLHDNSLNLLKHEIERVFGRPVISYRECLLLSEEIYEKTSFKISHNTLRRFFGLVKAEYRPSSSTIDILTNYCGFKSLDELIRKRAAAAQEYDRRPVQDFVNFIIKVFKHTPVKQLHDPTFSELVKYTIMFLQDYPAYMADFQKEIAKTKNGQDYYFEQFVNIDWLNSYFAEGIHHYLREKKNDSAQIYGHALLCIRAWLTDRPGDLKLHFEEITRYTLSPGMHPFIQGLYYAALILYADEVGMNISKIFWDAQQTHASISFLHEEFKCFPWFEYICGMALVLTQHFIESLYFLDIVEDCGNKQPDVFDKGFYETLLLLKSFALLKTGDCEEAKRLYQSVRTSQFYFLSKKFDTIFFLIVGKYFQKPNLRAEEQLERLLEETGFVKLRQLYESGKPTIGMLNSVVHKVV
jgi:hypothetical protein